MSSPLYFLADTVQTPLDKMGEIMHGESTQIVPFGPWELKMNTYSETDNIHAVKSSLFVHLTGNVFGYIVQTMEHSTLYILDGLKAGLDSLIKDWTLPVYAGINISTTLEGLRKSEAVKAVFRFTDNKWMPLNADSLD